MTDPSTLVKRLRALVIIDEVNSDNPLGREAADEIERLRELRATDLELREADRAEIEWLRAKSRELASTIATRLLDKDTKELRDEIERLRVMYSDCIKDLREASE